MQCTNCTPEKLCHDIIIWLLKIKSGENKMIRAILSSFASEKCFLCSAAFFLYPSCILNFCHWHCKLFCHLAEQYSTDYFHVYACRKTDICSDNLLTSHIASWIFFAQDGIRLSRVIALFNGFWSLMHACITIMMWFLDFIFFLKKKWWHNMS